MSRALGPSSACRKDEMADRDHDIERNHQRYLERKALYKSFGYDVDCERAFILRQAQPVRGRILEAGTGKGHFAIALAKEGYSFISFDISAEEQHVARMNITHAGFEKQVDFRIENGECTSFAEASFDTVFSVNVLHHLQDPYRVINEFVRLTAPGGKLVLADFTSQGFLVMDQIHRLEGGVHAAGVIGLEEAEVCLAAQGFSVKKISSGFQCVLTAQKG